MHHRRFRFRWPLVAAALLLGACSGAPKRTEPEREWNTEDEKANTQEPDSTATEAQAPLSLEDSCQQFRTLREAGCDWTQRFPPDFSDADMCQGSLATWVDPATPNHVSLERTIRCWSLDCDDAVPCMLSAQKLREPEPARACGDEGTAPILVDDATWQARRGVLAKRFADVRTSVEEPVEVCGIEGEIEWMMAVQCNDGSQAYGTMAEVNDGRDSWLDRGGRCNSVLDRYTVTCPEATYTIHVDRYLCPETE
jgi:hypothetical protein